MGSLGHVAVLLASTRDLLNQSKHLCFSDSERTGRTGEGEWLLTGHLRSLQVPQMLHCHLQDVRLLQFGVSGALRGSRTGQADR